MNIFGEWQKQRNSSKDVIKTLESHGCEVNISEVSHEGIVYRVNVPGLDAQLMKIFQGDLPVQDEQVSHVFKKWLWDQAEIRLLQNGQFESCRWIYWTPFQTALHLCLSSLALYGTVSAGNSFQSFGIGFFAMNALPLLLSWRESRRFPALCQSLSPISTLFDPEVE